VATIAPLCMSTISHQAACRSFRLAKLHMLQKQHLRQRSRRKFGFWIPAIITEVDEVVVDGMHKQQMAHNTRIPLPNKVRSAILILPIQCQLYQTLLLLRNIVPCLMHFQNYRRRFTFDWSRVPVKKQSSAFAGCIVFGGSRTVQPTRLAHLNRCTRWNDLSLSTHKNNDIFSTEASRRDKGIIFTNVLVRNASIKSKLIQQKKIRRSLPPVGESKIPGTPQVCI
jgi:hypothetical protein